VGWFFLIYIYREKCRILTKGLTSLSILFVIFTERRPIMTNPANIKRSLANMKGIEAQLSSLALNSLDKGAQEVFHESMITIASIKKDLQTHILELERLESQYKS
jgi:Protein of unknown function (DUF1657)